MTLFKKHFWPERRLNNFIGEENTGNCPMENQADGSNLPASAWVGAAAAGPLPTRSPGPGGQPAPRSYPGAAASAAVHAQTRSAAVRSRGPRILGASAWATVGSWGNSRALRGVAFHLFPDVFFPLTRVQQSEMGAPKGSGRDLN